MVLNTIFEQAKIPIICAFADMKIEKSYS
jgi:hypothetical protein